jgi:hypothetical protein
LAKATSDSMTGTSMSTPTTVASAAPEVEAEQADGHGHGQLEEVGRADHGGGGGHVEGQLHQQAGEAVADGEDAVALDDQRARR